MNGFSVYFKWKWFRRRSTNGIHHSQWRTTMALYKAVDVCHGESWGMVKHPYHVLVFVFVVVLFFRWLTDWWFGTRYFMTFHFIYGMSSQPHWRTHFFQDGYCTTNQLTIHMGGLWLLLCLIEEFYGEKPRWLTKSSAIRMGRHPL